MNHTTVGVVGIGTIGIGVVQSFACHGFKVIAVDMNDTILNQAKDTLEKNIRLYSFYQTAKNKKWVDQPLDNVLLTTNYNELASANLIIENVTEDIEVKQGIYQKLNTICQPETIYAANTSCISITKIGSWANHPENVLGIHFMNPVPIKHTVEMIRGMHTSDETINNAISYLKTIDKKQVLVNDSPGFVSNRISHLFMNEACYVVQDQVGKPEAVDTIFVECFGHKMGPLATADLIGLDTVLHSLDVLYQSYCDSKYRPCPLLRKMVDAGKLGRKSGQGFYIY